MKRSYFIVLSLFLSFSVQAEDVYIPLFEDDIKPNLGRDAQPLKELSILPESLGDVKISLDDTKKQSAQPPKKQTKSEKETVKKPSKPISLSPKSNQISEENKQLSEKLKQNAEKFQQDLAKEQAEKKRLENEKKMAELKKKQAEQQKLMPESLTDIFGNLHDVRTFDIAGVALGMDVEETIEMAQENGYTVTKVEHGIPLHRTTIYEQNCRLAKLYRTDIIKNCVIEQAKEDELYYVSSITFAKPQTAEFLQVLFSSPLTDNLSYKVYYENKGDNSLNFTRKNLAKKISRRDAFFNMLYDNYGYPDDKELLIWGDSQTAYMQALMRGANYDAYLVLEDKELSDNDLMDMHDEGKALQLKHNFTFAPSDDEE